MIEVRDTEKPASGVDAREYRLFRALDRENKGQVSRSIIQEVLARVGLSLEDVRLREIVQDLERHRASDPITYQAFCKLVRPNILLVERAIQGNLVIPDFDDFCRDVGEIHEETRAHRDGDVARYIPQLSRVDPEYHALAACSIDGQRHAAGDSKVDFCVQSCAKPITYCVALEEHGEDHVHRYVGREPSGHGFNELRLNKEGRPHNPLINAGAIMCGSLIRPKMTAADRFEFLLESWCALSGGQKARFSNSVYLSERQTADRNFALAYFMREHRAFPEGIDLIETLEFYFQCCAIEVNAEQMAVIAATFANGGVCPITGERVFKPQTVRNCLSLMYSCGMYDYSGEFAFTIGLPAKSGVSGALMIVVPNVAGICVWSPRVDWHGNSVRGVAFAKRLVETFNFHNYDNLSGLTEKKDPRKNRIQAAAERVNELVWAASKGDIGAIHRLTVRGIDLDGADYDRRTALHLAAAEGRAEVVRYFVNRGADLNPRDRWGGTPLDDAVIHGHEAVAEVLEKNGGIRCRPTATPDAGRASENEGFVSLTPLAPADSDKIVELIWAASVGDMPAILRLVARGIDLDGSDYDHRKPLHLAAAEGHEEVVRYLLAQGVEVNPRDRWGGTPLADAIRHDRQCVGRILEEHGGIA